jgi:hypothetical protein
MAGVSVVAGDAVLNVDVDCSFLHTRPHIEHDMSSVETNNLQTPGQTEPVVNSYVSGEASLSIAHSSGQTLVPITVSGSSLPNRDEAGPVTVDISTFTIMKIIDKWPHQPSRPPDSSRAISTWLAENEICSPSRDASSEIRTGFRPFVLSTSPRTYRQAHLRPSDR